MRLSIATLLTLTLGFASAQTPAPVAMEASSLPSGSSMPSAIPSGSPSSFPSDLPSLGSSTPSSMPSDSPTPLASSPPSFSPSAAATPSPLPVTTDSIATIVTNSAIHEIFYSALMIIGTSDVDAPGITLLAPTDAAFGAMVKETGRLITDIFTPAFIRHLHCFVRSHILSGVLTENVLAQKPLTVTTRSGFEVSVTTEDGIIQVGGVPVDLTNVPASNGVIHFLDTLPIIPACVGLSIMEQIAETPLLATTVQNIGTSFVQGFLDRFSPITFLAPSNEAWLKLPASVLTYLEGNATAMDIVLKYHVFGGVEFLGGSSFNTTFTTVSGDTITVARVGGQIFVTGQTNVGSGLDVTFLSLDDLAQNGVFHTIDRVLMPPSLIIPIFVICFPGDSTVHVKGVGETLMKNLKIGDEVLTSSDTYDKVYGFGHNQPDAIGEYFEISTKETAKPLQLSKDHMLFVDSGKAVAARSLKVGDEILLETGKKASITKISTVFANGAFAPFTESGSIVVNGVVASSYIAMDDNHDMLTLGGVELPVSHQWMAHASQAPHRVYCRMFDCTVETYTADGVSEWVAGPYTAGRLLLEQNFLTQLLAVLVGMPLLVLCAVLDMVANSPVAVATGVAGLYSLSSMYKLRLTSPK